MTDERLATHTFRVIRHVLDLKARLARPDAEPFFDLEWRRLEELLQGGDIDQHPHYAGGRNPRATGDVFHGVRYALVSWADELFIFDSRWSALWTDKTMEDRFYRHGQRRAYMFWDQAEAARKQSDPDPAEAYLWCVMLGFRGTPGDASPPVSPPDWVKAVREKVLTPMKADYPLPVDRGIPFDAYPLRGRDLFRRMAQLGGVLAAVGVFAAAVYLVQ